MHTPTDTISRAAKDGLVLSYALVKEAHASVDRTALESAERSRYNAQVWDGKSPCPVGDASRWLHGEDATSRRATDNIAAGGVVYFLFRDGRLVAWQPFAAVGGHKLVANPGAPDHWETDVDSHVAMHAEGAVDEAHYRAVLDKALALHEERGVPYHGTISA